MKLKISTDAIGACVKATTPNGHTFDVLVKLDKDLGLSVELFTGGNHTDTKSWEWSDLDLYSDDQISEKGPTYER